MEGWGYEEYTISMFLQLNREHRRWRCGFLIDEPRLHNKFIRGVGLFKMISAYCLMDMSGSEFHSVDIAHCNWGHVNLSGSAFFHSSINRVSFSSMSAVNLLLVACNLSFAHMAGADLSRMDVKDTHFDNVNFSGANLHGATFKDSHFVNCCFTEANLSMASFLRCSFLQSEGFYGANWSGTSFTECDGDIDQVRYTTYEIQGTTLQMRGTMVKGILHYHTLRGRFNLGKAEYDMIAVPMDKIPIEWRIMAVDYIKREFERRKKCDTHPGAS